MDWPTEVTLEFLKLYELEPVIWNPKDANHKNRTAVQEAWMRIQQILSISCTIPNLKRKKDSLMATFRPMINKYKETRKPGTNPEDAYTPTWFAFETMARFLHPFYNPKTTTNGEERNTNRQTWSRESVSRLLKQVSKKSYKDWSQKHLVLL
ncbi:hypothetical protein FQR65_LT10932 [Abscondita terminalis]|nr:hypothetical protein FQR65_LT10932 [Abscondita terminalis]